MTTATNEVGGGGCSKRVCPFLCWSRKVTAEAPLVVSDVNGTLLIGCCVRTGRCAAAAVPSACACADEAGAVTPTSTWASRAVTSSSPAARTRRRRRRVRVRSR